jgi:hypothetical protein
MERGLRRGENEIRSRREANAAPHCRPTDQRDHRLRRARDRAEQSSEPPERDRDVAFSIDQLAQIHTLAEGIDRALQRHERAEAISLEPREQTLDERRREARVPAVVADLEAEAL